MDDHALLSAYLRDRSEPAFTQLVAKYLPLVHTAALRRMNGDEHRAREITQLVFTQLAQQADRLVHHPALAAWLHQSTRWHAANLRRAENRRARHEAAAAQQLVLEESPGTAPSWDALRPILDAALDSLRDADRDAVLQRYFLDRPFTAIGQHFGVGENAARMRVERALETLRKALARHGVTSSAAALAFVLTQHAGATALPGGLTAGAVAATACQAAAAGSLATAGVTLLMTKYAIGVAAACVAVLGVMLWRQEETNQQLARELATRRTPLVAAVSPRAPVVQSPVAPNPPALPSRALQDIEDEILAAAEFAVPLTAEQQERVRLDTIIRKGELDGEYAMLFRQLKLPPATLDALKTLLVERNQAIYDARQLALEEGLVFASMAEARAVANSAVAEVDTRISTLIGGDGYAKLREHVDLEFYRQLAGVARRNNSISDPTDDERVRELARRLHEAAPNHEEEIFQRNGWPGDVPLVIRETIAAFDRNVPLPEWPSSTSSFAIHWRMAEIARDALLDGRITMNQLSGRVAAEYRAARERREKTATP